MNKPVIFFLVIVLIFLSYAVIGEETETETGWETKGNFAINASQTSFTDWAAGGDNSVIGNSFLTYTAVYKRNKMSWDNSLELGIGYMKQGEADLFKTDDRIAIASKYGRLAFDNWHYTALVSFRTQFTEGLRSIADDTKVSDFMAPGYLTVSIGMDYKPNENLTIMISPLAGRQTYVLNDTLSNLGAYGVKPGKQVRSEFGGFLKIQYSLDIMENINFKTNMEVFSNYLDKPQNLNLNWENILNLKINSYISANVHLTMIYDDDMKVNYDSTGDGVKDKNGPRLQIRNIMGIGFMYKFSK